MVLGKRGGGHLGCGGLECLGFLQLHPTQGSKREKKEPEKVRNEGA